MHRQDNLDIAEAELNAGQPRLAVQFAQYAVTKDPDNERGWHLLGVAAMKVGDYPVAIDAYEQLSLRSPIGANARITLAIAYGCVGRKSLSRDLLMAVATGSPDADQLLRIAAGLEAVDEPQLAMEACRRAGKMMPDAAEVHYQMAYYSSLCGHPVSVAEALMRHAVSLEPENLHYRIGLSSLLIRLNRRADAIGIIEHLIPGRLEEVTCECCLKRIANLFFDLGQMEPSKQCAERLAELRDSCQVGADRPASVGS
ncbi:MAG: hypothetical protein AAGJ40_00750 [Planctomycetota bacterium]